MHDLSGQLYAGIRNLRGSIAMCKVLHLRVFLSLYSPVSVLYLLADTICVERIICFLFVLHSCQAMPGPAGDDRSPFSPQRPKRDEREASRRTRKEESRSRHRRREKSDSSRSEPRASKQHRRRSPSRHERRGPRDGRKESSAKASKREQDAAAGDDPDKPPCEHCGQPLTKHLSGRKQHQWMSIPCLTHQFYTMR